MAIQLPPKIYLDTAHLISISKCRYRRLPANALKFSNAYSRLSEMVSSGQVGLIFNLPSVLEWLGGSATIESAREIAEVLDSATLVYEVAPDRFVYTREILDEFRTLNADVVVPEFEVFWCRTPPEKILTPLQVLSGLVPDVYPLAAENESVAAAYRETAGSCTGMSFSLMLERTLRLKSEKRGVFDERPLGYLAAFEEDLRSFMGRSEKILTVADFRQWAVKYLAIDQIINALNPSLDVASLLSKLDLRAPEFRRRCPATSLYFEHRIQRLSARTPAKESDTGDAEFLQAVCFSDFVLTDRNHRHFLVAADRLLKRHVFASPNDLVSALQAA